MKHRIKCKIAYCVAIKIIRQNNVKICEMTREKLNRYYHNLGNVPFAPQQYSPD
jgi:hypothetical protein